MIRINLLPATPVNKKDLQNRQLAFFCISLLAVLVIVAALYLFKLSQIETAKEEIAAAQIKVAELDKKIGKLKELKTLQNQVKQKLDVLLQLRKNKSGPAERLANLSDMTPEKLWLTGYAESGHDVKLSGIAYSEELIAEFMRKLGSTSNYSGVELVVSEQIISEETKLKKFELACKLKGYIKPEPEPQKSK